MGTGKGAFGLCLCRETPRRFELERCSDIRLLSSNDVLMPVPFGSSHNSLDSQKNTARQGLVFSQILEV